MHNTDFGKLLRFYEDHLRNQVLPFWLAHGIDWQKGGVFNLIQDSGRLVSSDKFVWSQGRALWTFSALYNHFERSADWLELADRTASFLLQWGRKNNYSWPYRLSRDGDLIDPTYSVYVDAFVIYGLAEYAKASGNEEALEAALSSFERMCPLLDDHSTLPTKPHHIPQGMQAHGPSMIFALVFHELGLLSSQPQILDKALALAEIVMSQHLKEEDETLYEFVRPGGDRDFSDAGKTYIPGHVIESMWFMERIYDFHEIPERVNLAIAATQWHLESGWDKEYGGLFLACHKENGNPIWHSPNSKLWWTITETLYALLRFYEVSGNEWCLRWYSRVHDYGFRVHPNLEHGEWVQNLDRFGRRIPAVVTDLPVKDPFHLPRCLIYSIQVLRRLAQRVETNVKASIIAKQGK